MIEMLVLIALLDGKSSIYGIKQKIEANMGLFLKISFGSIYPALSKLEKKKIISVRSQISEGGQRRSLYSITSQGREHFNQLMLEELPDNPTTAAQLLKVKLFSISKLSQESKEQVKINILNFLDTQKLNAKNLLSSTETKFDKLQKAYIEYTIHKYSDDIEWVKSFL
jgi:DNA-binding PadR family transcriptional regulator